MPHRTLGSLTPGARLYTCEHASNAVPAPFRPRPSDRRLLGTHWGYDIGAARVTEQLQRRDPGSAAVLSRFSRLLIDPNRDPNDPTAILQHTHEGSPSFNQSPDLHARVARFHAPFHAAVAAVVAQNPRCLVSIHSFTPVWQSIPRTVEAGVLYDAHEPWALRLVDALRREGLRTEPNEPYSGKAGLIYSAARHGRGMPYLEIELRQDLIASRRGAIRIAAMVARALNASER